MSEFLEYRVADVMSRKLAVVKAFAFTSQSTMPRHEDTLPHLAEGVMTRTPLYLVTPDMPLTSVLATMIETRNTSFPFSTAIGWSA